MCQIVAIQFYPTEHQRVPHIASGLTLPEGRIFTSGKYQDTSFSLFLHSVVAAPCKTPIKISLGPLSPMITD